MLFAFLTFLAALALAGVAGWFSIIGVMAIYAAAPFHSALVMGVVLEFAKLVTTSWIYRNWSHCGWSLKAPLIYFVMALMLATSIGVYGFLSKAHLEQGSSTVNNSAKVEQISQLVSREQSTIASAEKTLAQLDATLDSYIGKDRADRSIVVRARQAPQRKELKAQIDEAQKRLNTLNDEKFVLESDVRKLQLEVGPIRYIAELIYGSTDNPEKSIEAAVRIFTLLIVSTLDPLAVVLLIAANHSLLRISTEKSKKAAEPDTKFYEEPPPEPVTEAIAEPSDNVVHEDKIDSDTVPQSSEGVNIPESPTVDPIVEDDLSYHLEFAKPMPHSRIYSPKPARVNKDLLDTAGPWAQQSDVLSDLVGSNPHFIPTKVNTPSKETDIKNPKVLNWLDEFKRH